MSEARERVSPQNVKAELRGYIPTGWYPSSLAVTPDGKRLLVTNAKGTSVRNPNNVPDPHDPKSKKKAALAVLEKAQAEGRPIVDGWLSPARDRFNPETGAYEFTKAGAGRQAVGMNNIGGALPLLAQSLALLHTDDTDVVAAQLADQYARGGRPDSAVTHYARAADIASGTFAHGEAIRLHRAALAIIATQPDGTRRQRQELTVLEAMAAPLNARHGYASGELRKVYFWPEDLQGHTERTYHPGT